MPTVPRQQSREVLADQMPGPRNTVSATEETFGGGAANKQVVAAAEQLNTTLQNKMARDKALQSSLRTNKLLSLAEQEALKAHYDQEDTEFEEIDPTTNKPVKKIAPGGILLASGEQASYGGGAGKRSLETTMQIADKYVSQLGSAEEADRFIMRYSKIAQTLNDRANSHEIAQKKAYYDKETESRLDMVAQSTVLPRDERILEIRNTAYKNGQLAGEPISDAEEKIAKATYKAYESDLFDMFNARIPDEKAINKLMKDAEAKEELSPEQLSSLRARKDTLESKKTVAESEARTAAEEKIATTELTIENEWKLPWVKEDKPKRVKKIPKGGLTEAEYEKQVFIANKNSADMPFVETDNETHTELMLKMVAPGYADEKKRLDHITAYAGKKLHPNDYNYLGKLYAMDPESKDFASQGLKGINDYVNREEKGYPDIKRTLMDDFLTRMEKKKPDERVEDVLDDTLDAYNKKSGKYPANTKKEDAPNSVASVQQGKAVQFQNTGMTSAPKKKPDATLSPSPKNDSDEYEYKTVGNRTFRRKRVKNA